MSNSNPESASTPDRRAQFKQAFRNLQLSPLLKPEERARFKVEYNEALLDDLEQKIDFADSESKTIFTGHQGCGKSTLLAELSARLEECFAQPHHHTCQENA
jgi:predicted ATPase